MRRFVKVLGLAVLAGVFTNPALSERAAAQTVPFFIVGSGQIPEGIPFTEGNPRPHNSIGFASYVGLHTGEGAIVVTEGPESPEDTTAEFKSDVPYEFTSVFGRRNTLAFDYGVEPFASKPGEVEIFPVDLSDPNNPILIAVFLAEFTPNRAASTGRFKRVKGGSFWMLAVSEPFMQAGPLGIPTPDDPDQQIGYSWVGVGTLKF